MFDYGNQLYKNGNYEEALLEYLKSIDENDSSLYNAGICLYKTQKYEKAIILFKSSIKKNYFEKVLCNTTTTYKSIFNIICSLYFLNNYEKAQKYISYLFHFCKENNIDISEEDMKELDSFGESEYCDFTEIEKDILNSEEDFLKLLKSTIHLETNKKEIVKDLTRVLGGDELKRKFFELKNEKVFKTVVEYKKKAGFIVRRFLFVNGVPGTSFKDGEYKDSCIIEEFSCKRFSKKKADFILSKYNVSEILFI